MSSSEKSVKAEKAKPETLLLNRDAFNYFIAETKNKLMYFNEVAETILKKMESPSMKIDSFLLHMLVVYFVVSSIFNALFPFWKFIWGDKKEPAEAPRSNASSSRSRGISSGIRQVVVERKEAQEQSIIKSEAQAPGVPQESIWTFGSTLDWMWRILPSRKPLPQDKVNFWSQNLTYWVQR